MSCDLMASLGKIRRCEMQIKLICTKCVPDNYKNVIGEIKNVMGMQALIALI